MTLVLDTETTGLLNSHLLRLSRQPEIIELFMATVDPSAGTVSESFNNLIKPKGIVSPEITRITGIKQSDVDPMEPFSHHAELIKQWVESSPAICAHNASFDVEMLTLEFERLGIKIKWPKLICTVEQTVHLLGYRLSLSALHEHLFHEKFPEAHRAKNDVMALARCVMELHKRGEL